MREELITKAKEVARKEKKKYNNLTKQQLIWLKLIVDESHKTEKWPVPDWTWALALGHYGNPPDIYQKPKIRVPGGKYAKVAKRIINRFNSAKGKHHLSKYKIYPGSNSSEIVIYGEGEYFTNAINAS